MASDGKLEVIGENTVTVVDAGDITYTNLPDLERNQALTLHGVRIHVLSTGHKFDLEKRAPVDETEKAEKGKAAAVGKAKADRS